MTDMTTSIQASVSDVEFELMLTIGLVVCLLLEKTPLAHTQQKGAH